MCTKVRKEDWVNHVWSVALCILSRRLSVRQNRENREMGEQIPETEGELAEHYTGGRPYSTVHNGETLSLTHSNT